MALDHARRTAIALCFLVVSLGRAADLEFSGTLDRVNLRSLAVRLQDGRRIEARLPESGKLARAAIVAEYKAGDHVAINCRSIDPVWDYALSRYQFLDLRKIRLVQRPENESKPTESAGELVTDEELTEARRLNLEYAAHLPNFVADETAKRYRAGDRLENWRYADTIESEITVTGAHTSRRYVRRNGKRWTRPFQALPGFKWAGGFGTEIRPLFDAQCPTMITPEGSAEVRGKAARKYAFRSLPDGCFEDFYFEYQRYNPARAGYFFIAEPGGRLIQFEEQASEFPAEFEIFDRTEEVFWDNVIIGGATHLLPVAAHFLVVYTSGERWRIEVQYKNHRHFEASANVTFP